MVTGISNVLSASGYQIMLACTNNHEKEELKYLRLFKENHVDGIILLGTIFTSAHAELLASLAVPIVILGQNIQGYSCIYSDDYQAAYHLGMAVAPKGREFGMIQVTERDTAVGLARKQGFLDALRDCGIMPEHFHSITSEFTLESGYRSAEELLTKHPDLDTLFCATDTIACGALQYLHTTNRSIPEDIQITGFGDSFLSHVTTPTLTTVHFYYEEAGEKAARHLLECMKKTKNRDALNLAIKLDFRLSLQASTRS